MAQRLAIWKKVETISRTNGSVMARGQQVLYFLALGIFGDDHEFIWHIAL
jgi:hypothetical protein